MTMEETQRTVLLCKPSSQDAHHVIAQELQASGLVIERRLLNLTPEQAIALVLQYPAMQGRVAYRPTNRPNTTTIENGDEAGDKAAELPDFIKAARRHRQRGLTSSSAAVLPPSPSSSTSSSSQQQQQRQQMQQRSGGGSRSTDHRLLTHIQQLAQGSRLNPPNTTAAATTMGAALPRRLSTSLPSPESAEGRYRAPTAAAAVSASQRAGLRLAHATTLTYRRSQLSFPTAYAASPGQALDTVLDHPALEDPLVRQHVEHLVHDGTALLLLLHGADAVAKVAELCGPDSVEDARSCAPRSWTARFGRDDVRNGVYAPRTTADAQLAIASLFPHSAVDRAVKSGATRLHAHAAPCAPVAAPITFAAVLPALRSQVDATRRLSYYTGVPSTVMPTLPVIMDTAHASTPLSTTAGRGDGTSETSVGVAPHTPTTTTMAHSATARFSSVAPFPERRERLDEFDNLLRQRTVGC